MFETCALRLEASREIPGSVIGMSFQLPFRQTTLSVCDMNVKAAFQLYSLFSLVITLFLSLSLSLFLSFLAHSPISVHSIPFVASSYTQLMSTHTSVMTDRRSGMIPSLTYRQTTSTIVSRAVAAAAANNHHHSIRRGGGTGRGSKRYSVSAFYSMAAEQDVEVHDELAKGEKKGG